MDYYFDIRLRPEPEFAPEQLMNALFGKLHRALVEIKSQDIGISFPGIRPERRTLGTHLRLHGGISSFQTLMATSWLTGMRDHVDVGDVSIVPDAVQHVAVRRVQVKSSVDRIRRRHIKRHGITEQEALERIPNSVEQRLPLPFIRLKSHSTAQVFRLFIRQEQTNFPVQGRFNTYGLSADATVPSF